MRYSAFEQAAAEATYGMKEIDGQLEQLKAQVEQLKAKRDLLYSLSSQLLAIRPAGPEAAASEAPAAPAAQAGPAEQPAAGDNDQELSAMGIATPPRSLRESGWFSGPADAIRGRL